MPKKFNIESGAFEDVDELPTSKRGKFIEILQPNTILNGIGEPSKSLGEDGDFYIETGSWEIYLKEGGSWGEGTSLRPSDGKDGIDGKDGKDGQHGEHGLDGERGAEGNGIVDITRKGGSLVVELSNGERKTFALPVPADGKDGRGILSIEQAKNGVVHVNYTDGTKTKLTLPQATSGREIELGSSSTHFQWRYKGEKDWRDLALIPKVKGRMGGGGGTHKGHNILDEGVALDQRTRLDFVGSGVTVTDDAANDKTIVTIGGGGSNITAKDEGSTLTSAMTSIDFVGSAVTATNSGGDVTVTISGGLPAGSDGQLQYNNGGAFGGASNVYFDDTNLRVGLNTTSPEGVLHVKNGTYTAPPEPTGTLTLSETNIGSGNWTNDGNSFEVRVYTYKVVEGATLYSSTYLSQTYGDDVANDHTYNLLLEIDTALPAGADGYRAFVQWTDSGAVVQWNYNQYFSFADLDVTINGSPTAGTPTSGTVVYKSIHEGVEAWFKDDVRFMDSSGNTIGIWDSTNERFGIGTTSPASLFHLRAEGTSAPSNPTGTVTVTEVTGYDDPYENIGTTHIYRVYAYKLVNGYRILSNTYLTGTYTDDGGTGSFYSLEVTMSNTPPAGADGYVVVKNSLGYTINSYWSCSETGFIDGGTAITTDYAVQQSTTTEKLLIDQANIDFAYNGSRVMSYNATNGSFSNISIRATSTSTPFEVRTLTGSTSPLAVFYLPNGSTGVSFSSAGAGAFAAGITATTGAFSGTLSVTGAATLSNNLTVGGTLSVTSAASFVSTITARSSTFTATNSGSVGLTVNGVSGQTVDIAQWRLTSGGTLVSRITSGGIFDSTGLVQSAAGFRLTAFGAYVGVQSGSRCTFGNGSGVSTFGTGNTAHVVSLIEAPTGQTADIQQWRVNSVNVAQMSAAGNIGIGISPLGSMHVVSTATRDGFVCTGDTNSNFLAFRNSATPSSYAWVEYLATGNHLSFYDTAERIRFLQGGGGINLGSNGMFRITGSNAGGTVDVALGRNAAGVFEINNGTAGTFRDLKARHIDLTGNITQTGYIITNSVSTENYGWSQKDGSNTYYLTLGCNENLTANRSLAIVLNDANRALTITGDATLSGTNSGDNYRPYVAKTGAYTLTSSDGTVNCTSGTFAITLPTAVGATGRVYTIKNTGAGTITLNTTSSQTIDGAASGTITLTTNQSRTVQSDGANWIILAST